MYCSIIVPVYQVAPYLRTCVDSILTQTFRDFELILVDDGSTDEGPALCDAYAARDSRVRVIHQPNRGVVRARQAGLRASSGAYILFVDGDDWVAPNCLARGRELVEETQAELVLFAAARVYEDGVKPMPEPVPQGLYHPADKPAELFASLVLDAQMKHLSYSCSGKIFCRALAEQGLCSVDAKIRLGEDMLSVLPAYLGARSIYVSHEVMNFYRVRAQSASRRFCLTDYHQVALVLEALERMEQRVPGLPADFGRQIDRYAAYMSLALLIHGVERGSRPDLRAVKARMCRPPLNARIHRARFQGITLKTRITYALFRRDWIVAAYGFLTLCHWIKRCWKGAARWIGR